MAVCPTCGAPVVACAGCGAPVGGKFCAACGAPAAAPRALPPELAATMPAKAPGPPSAADAPSLSRSPGDAKIVGVHASPVAARTVVVVDDGETFCGINDGRVVAVHPAGRHAIMLPLTSGLFVRHGVPGGKLGGPLGTLQDARGASGSVAAFGDARFDIVDPPAFVLGLGAPFDAEAGVAWLKPKALDALRSALAEALQRGDLALAGLAALPPAVLARAAELFGTARPMPGVDLAFTSATARVTDVAEPPPPIAAPPAPPQAAAPAGFAPGQAVLVQWADGNRYPAHVIQSAGDRCLVGFPNGGQDWVPHAYLAPA